MILGNPAQHYKCRVACTEVASCRLQTFPSLLVDSCTSQSSPEIALSHSIFYTMSIVRASNNLLDPCFGSSIFDPFLNFSLFDRRPFSGLSVFPPEVSTVANARMDWVETPEAHVFKADLPGLKKEDIKIQVTDDQVLSISGERTKEEVDESDSFRHVERSYGKFCRQFRLPENTKPQDVSAKMENGVLTVRVPKTEVAKKTEVRTVEITS